MSLARLITALTLAPTLAAATPLVMTHSGYVLDASDTALTEPSLAADFRIYVASAPVNDETALWTSGSCNVAVKAGFYAVSLGAGSGSADGCGTNLDSASIPPGAARYLEVSLAGQRLLPRLRIGSVPTAAVAVTSLDAQALTTALAATGGTLNDSANPVDWSRLKGVPADLADGDADTLTQPGAGLELVGSALAVKAGGITPAMLDRTGATTGQVLVNGGSSLGWGKLGAGSLDSTGATQGQPLVAGAGGAVTWGTLGAAALSSTGATQGQALVAGAGGTVTWGNVQTSLVLASNSGLTGDGLTVGTGLALATAEGSLAKVSGGALTANAGSIGVGSANPAVKLDVNGAVRLGTVADGVCTSATQGILRYQNDMLQVCFSTGWRTISQNQIGVVLTAGQRKWADGTSAASCNAYRNPTSPYTYAGDTGSGVYSIKVGANAAFDAYCDMATDNGGWTLVAKVNGADADTVLYPAWVSTSTVGTITDFSTTGGGDVIYPAHNQVTGSELMFSDSAACGGQTRLLQTASVLAGKTLRQYLNDLPTAASTGSNTEANFTTPAYRNTGCTHPFNPSNNATYFSGQKFGMNITDSSGPASIRFTMNVLSYDNGIASTGTNRSDGYNTGDLDARSDGVDNWTGHVATVFVR